MGPSFDEKILDSDHLVNAVSGKALKHVMWKVVNAMGRKWDLLIKISLPSAEVCKQKMIIFWVL